MEKLKYKLQFDEMVQKSPFWVIDIAVRLLQQPLIETISCYDKFLNTLQEEMVAEASKEN